MLFAIPSTTLRVSQRHVVPCVLCNNNSLSNAMCWLSCHLEVQVRFWYSWLMFPRHGSVLTSVVQNISRWRDRVCLAAFGYLAEYGQIADSRQNGAISVSVNQDCYYHSRRIDAHLIFWWQNKFDLNAIGTAMSQTNFLLCDILPISFQHQCGDGHVKGYCINEEAVGKNSGFGGRGGHWTNATQSHAIRLT